MNVEREVQAAQRRLRVLGERRLKECEARDAGVSYAEYVGELTPGQQLGAAYRQLNDALQEFLTDFALGWEQAGRR